MSKTHQSFPVLKPNQALLFDRPNQQWLWFEHPLQTFCATQLDQVIPLLDEVEYHTHQQRTFAVGFVSYEAAPAFDSAMHTHEENHFPLAWFGLYRQGQPIPSPPRHLLKHSRSDLPTSWLPSISRAEYTQHLEQIRHLLKQGKTYQVNFTMRLHTQYSCMTNALFQRMIQAQGPKHYGVWIELEHWSLCSASPELFFEKQGHVLRCQPMKGTAPRGRWFEEDQQHAQQLRASIKNQAENAIIVDMVRNDMTRIAQPGTVHTPSLFDVEQYPTLWQMTSQIRCHTQAKLSEIFCALFPPASITGAPKISTMHIIHTLESTPRYAYTGAIGWLKPNGNAQFNIAIRTAILNKTNQCAEYSVGGGIVWDSTTRHEWQECQTKAKLLTHAPPPFQLLETMRWSPTTGILYRQQHLERIQKSAAYFGFPCSLEKLERQLQQHIHKLRECNPNREQILRIRLDSQGVFHLETKSLYPLSRPYRIAFAKEPIDPQDPFLYHKTTHRQQYDRAREAHPEADDVLLWNPNREIT
ncbi:MAG: aminodeoxychorismate synthase component I, partial [Myxococcota bacterium]